MGINGLLKQLESIQTKKHLSEYRGKRVAVDGYCWLHKAIYLIKSEVFENPNSTKYLQYLAKRIDSLKNNDITPIIIFDGDKLPMKKVEEDDRQKRRQESQVTARELYRKGMEDTARQKMIESMDVSPEMAYNFIKELEKRNIEFIVAPYEADAQLAYLSKIQYVDLVITEDSDLLALGCNKVLFKLDADTCWGTEINLEDLPKCREYDFNFFNQDQDLFLLYCILCGCDYFKMKGVGFKTAYNIVKEKNSLDGVLQYIRVNNKNTAMFSNEIEKDFKKAFLTFKFQVIYCPKEKKLRHFNDIEKANYTFIKDFEDKSFLGRFYDEILMNGIVSGIIDPITHRRFKERKSDIVSRMFNSQKLNIENQNKMTLDEKNYNEIEELLEINEERNSSENINSNIVPIISKSDFHKISNNLDSIQNLAYNLSHPNNKRKFPYSDQPYLNQNKTKMFRYENNYKKSNCINLPKDTLSNRISQMNTNYTQTYDANKIESVDIIKEKSENNVTMQNNKSKRSDDDFDYNELFVTYDDAKSMIKNCKGDKNKLDSVHFEANNNKIIASYEPLEIKTENNKNISVNVEQNLDSSINFQNELNSVKVGEIICLDDYALDEVTQNSLVSSKDFILKRPKSNKNGFL